MTPTEQSASATQACGSDAAMEADEMAEVPAHRRLSVPSSADAIRSRRYSCPPQASPHTPEPTMGNQVLRGAWSAPAAPSR